MVAGAAQSQTKITQTILDREADYLLAVKDNWPNLHAEITRAFYDPLTTGLLAFDTTDGDHGRIEQRHRAVSYDVAFFRTDRRFPVVPRFPGLKAIAMVETEVKRGGKISRARFYLSSLTLAPKPLPAPSESTGTSRTACIKCSTSNSTNTSASSGPDTVHRTWPPSAT